jgi:hypothetical protein
LLAAYFQSEEDFIMIFKGGLLKKVAIVVVLLALAAVPLVVVSIGAAQEETQTGAQDGSPVPPNLEPPAEAEPADLVITDPQTDVQDAIKNTLNVNASGSVLVPASSLIVDGSGREWFFPFGWGYLYPNGANNYCGIASVYLPDGATITAMTAYVYDNDASQTVFVYLYPNSYKTASSYAPIASVSSVNSTSLQALTDATIDSTGNPVDLSTYTYYLGVCMWSTSSLHQFHGAEIFYSN